MKKIFVTVILLTLFAVSSCVHTTNPIAHDKGFPADGRYEILGTVSLTKRMTVIFGIFWAGGIEYSDLYGEAQTKYGVGVSDVVNVSVDREIMSGLGIVTLVDFTMRGTAIRYLSPSE